jgi:hypothetical protein
MGYVVAGKGQRPNYVSLPGDSEDSPPAFLGSSGLEGYGQWLASERALEKGLSRLATPVTVPALRGAIEQIDVSQGQETQRRQMALLNALAGDGTAGTFEEDEVRSALVRFVSRVQEKAINQCVRVKPIPIRNLRLAAVPRAGG